MLKKIALWASMIMPMLVVFLFLFDTPLTSSNKSDPLDLTIKISQEEKTYNGVFNVEEKCLYKLQIIVNKQAYKKSIDISNIEKNLPVEVWGRITREIDSYESNIMIDVSSAEILSRGFEGNSSYLVKNILLENGRYYFSLNVKTNTSQFENVYMTLNIRKLRNIKF